MSHVKADQRAHVERQQAVEDAVSMWTCGQSTRQAESPVVAAARSGDAAGSMSRASSPGAIGSPDARRGSGAHTVSGSGGGGSGEGIAPISVRRGSRRIQAANIFDSADRRKQSIDTPADADAAAALQAAALQAAVDKEDETVGQEAAAGEHHDAWSKGEDSDEMDSDELEDQPPASLASGKSAQPAISRSAGASAGSVVPTPAGLVAKTRSVYGSAVSLDGSRLGSGSTTTTTTVSGGSINSPALHPRIHLSSTSMEEHHDETTIEEEQDRRPDPETPSAPASVRPPSLSKRSGVKHKATAAKLQEQLAADASEDVPSIVAGPGDDAASDGRDAGVADAGRREQHVVSQQQRKPLQPRRRKKKKKSRSPAKEVSSSSSSSVPAATAPSPRNSLFIICIWGQQKAPAWGPCPPRVGSPSLRQGTHATRPVQL